MEQCFRQTSVQESRKQSQELRLSKHTPPLLSVLLIRFVSNPFSVTAHNNPQYQNHNQRQNKRRRRQTDNQDHNQESPDHHRQQHEEKRPEPLLSQRPRQPGTTHEPNPSFNIYLFLIILKGSLFPRKVKRFISPSRQMIKCSHE